MKLAKNSIKGNWAQYAVGLVVITGLLVAAMPNVAAAETVNISELESLSLPVSAVSGDGADMEVVSASPALFGGGALARFSAVISSSTIRQGNIEADAGQQLLDTLLEAVTDADLLDSNDPLVHTAWLADFLERSAHTTSEEYTLLLAAIGTTTADTIEELAYQTKTLYANDNSVWTTQQATIFAAQNGDGGFGYHESAVSDLETTLAVIDLFNTVGYTGNELAAALVYVAEQVDANDTIWYPDGETASYYLMERALITLHPYYAYNLTVGSTTYDISQYADNLDVSLRSSYSTSNNAFSDSTDITEIVMLYQVLRLYDTDPALEASVRAYLLETIGSDRSFGDVYTDLWALEALAAAELSVVSLTSPTATPRNGEAYTLSTSVENTGYVKPDSLVVHLYGGDVHLGTYTIPTASMPGPDQTLNYNFNISATAARKLLGNMTLRLLLEAAPTYQSQERADAVWGEHVEAIADHADPTTPALPLWMTAQEYLSSTDQSGVTMDWELHDDARRELAVFMYRVASTTSWSQLNLGARPAGIDDVNITGLTPNVTYDVTLGIVSGGTIYLNNSNIVTLTIPVAGEDLTVLQPVSISDMFVSVKEAVAAVALRTSAYAEALFGSGITDHIITAVRGTDAVYVDVPGAMAPLRRVFASDETTSTTSSAVSVHTYVYEDSVAPTAQAVTITSQANVTNPVELNSSTYYTIFASSTDNRKVQFHDVYLVDETTNDETYVGTIYDETFEWYVPDDLVGGTYHIELTATDYRGNTSAGTQSQSFGVNLYDSTDDDIRKQDLQDIADALTSYYIASSTFKVVGAGFNGNSNAWFSYDCASTGCSTYTLSVAEALQTGGHTNRFIVDPTGVEHSNAALDQSGYMIRIEGDPTSGTQTYTLWANLDNPSAADIATMDTCAASNYDNFSSNFPTSRQMNYCISGGQAEVLDLIRKQDLQDIADALTSHFVASGTYKVTGAGANGNSNGWFSYDCAATGCTNYPVSVAGVLEAGGYADRLIVDPTGVTLTNNSLDQSGYMIRIEGDPASGTQTYTLWANLDNPSAADLATMDTCAASHYDNYNQTYPASRQMNYCISGDQAAALDLIRKQDLQDIADALTSHFVASGTYKVASSGYNGSSNGWFSHDCPGSGCGYILSVAEALETAGFVDRLIVDPSGVESTNSALDQSGYMIRISGNPALGTQSYTLWANLDNPSAADIATMDTCVASNYDNFSSNFPTSRQMNYCISGGQTP